MRISLVLLTVVHWISANQCPGASSSALRPKYCKKTCAIDDDCRRHKKCLCDGECGLSCVNPGLTCPTLFDIPNGRVHWGGEGHFGANAEYSCDAGFVLVGPSQRRCQGNKEWSGALPVCRLQLKCGAPPEIAYAVHDGQSYTGEYDLDSEVHYHCMVGYNKYNQEGTLSTSKCLLNRKNVAQWFGPDIKCKARACPDPGKLDNGQREGDMFEYPHSVIFSCLPGFLLIGSSSRQCLETGDWTGDAPICKPTECPRPSDPLHGRVLGSSLTFESQVSYSCDPGYRLVGQKQRICLAEGQWAGREPSCEEIRCPPLPSLVNGYIEGSDTHYGAKTVFRCLESMSHTGPSESVCGENGEWSSQPPTCLASCIVPTIENGQAHLGPMYLPPGRLIPSGTKITIACQPRHEPSPSAPLECRNSSWNHVPICSPLNCLEWPPRVNRARVLFTKSAHGSVARYTCASGYHLNSQQDTIKCLYGEWTREGEPLACLETSCVHPSETFGDLPGGAIMLEGQMGAYDFAHYIQRVEEGRSIVFQCHKGNYLIGAPKASCVNGQWMPQIKPMCVSQTHPLIDGQIVWDRTRRETDDRPTTTQKPPRKERRRRRKERRHRSHRPPPISVLVPPICPVIKSDANRTVNLIREGEITIICRDGLTIEGGGGGRMSCTQGRWQPEQQPNCVPKSCILPVRLHALFVLSPLVVRPEERVALHLPYSHGASEVTPTEILQSGEELANGRETRITCMRGFDLIGSPRTRCNHGLLEQTIGRCESKASCSLPSAISSLFDPPRSIIDHGEYVDTPCGKVNCREGQLSEIPNCFNESTSSFRLALSTSLCDASPSSLVSWQKLAEYQANCNLTATGSNVAKPKRPRSPSEAPPAFIHSMCGPPPPFGIGMRVFNMENYVRAEHIAFPHGTILEVGCSVSSTGRSITEYRCDDGDWEHDEPVACEYGGAPCSFVASSRTSLVTFDEQRQQIVHFNQMFNDGARLRFRCANIGTQKLKGRHESVCSDGVWNSNPPVCVDLDPLAVKPDAIPIHYEVLNGASSISSKGELLIDRSTTVVFSCAYPRRLGQPKWLQEVTSTYRTYPKSLNSIGTFGRKAVDVYQLTVAVAQPEDSGAFYCIAPDGRRHGVRLRVHGIHCAPLTNSSTAFVHPSLPNLSSFFVGTHVQFSCPRGHAIRDGTTSALCTETGRWSAALPNCQPSSCSPLLIDSRQMLSVSVSSYLFGGTANFKCRSPFRLSPTTPPSIHCTSDGNWSGKVPECIEAKCGEATMPHNGYQLGEAQVTYPVGTRVHFGCLDKHRMEGPSSIECLSNGEWSEMNSRCRPLG
ncbi:hypothetical protein PENTCL1PPCAC_25601 [Pristionchus entomophagus]|uniref:Sushi domain-containing protein n=1 Tax=Pristionchus entomophagus TaxID=358040 RepID=A0AAV5U9G0_9BILA|nr:hypothetical protein PENTCL1PPCAC_25601 [Pristionchus entomophagus]